MTRGLSLSFLLLTACIPDSPKTVLGVDNDGDGYVAQEDGGDDCDDANTGVYPGAEEICDGLDNDCDGSLSDQEIDTDNDGYVGCLLEDGEWVGPNPPTGGNDCGEGDATYHPNADEYCDDFDTDCDGDTRDPDSVDTLHWIPDGDGDTFGWEAPVDSCDPPEGHISQEGVTSYDCRDDDPTVYPGATEICDGQGNDCDSSTQQSATPAIEIDSDGDNYVQCAELAEVWVGPANPNPPGPGDCNDNDETINPASTERCDSIDNDCDEDVDEDDASDASDWYTDLDGDGYGDPNSTRQACDLPTGMVADRTDCDDSDPDSYPGAREFCDGADNDCDGTFDPDTSDDALPWFRDADGDGYGDLTDSQVACSAPSGYVIDGTDCDDTDSAVNPGAIEFCDAIDNNCDLITDGSDSADALIWFLDSDSDGFGDVNNQTLACDQPAYHLADGTDCDDNDGATYPGATEYCNNRDNNCDGDVDDDDDPTDSQYADDASTYYLDTDGDNWGLTSNSVHACSQPSGYGSNMGDCDDGDASIHPGATEECGNGVDDNCDGYADDAPLYAITWYRDDDSDDYGQTGNSVTNCHQPNGFVSTPGDCNDADTAVNPGATELCSNTVDDNCDGSVNEGCGGSGSGGESSYDQCTDNADNDGDGFTDCSDCDCSYLSICANISCNGGGSTSGGENTDATCSDGTDNDFNGYTDCCDSSCSSTSYCSSGNGTCGGSSGGGSYEVCTGTGSDEDGDATADCSDTDCTNDFTPACVTGNGTTVVGGLTASDQFEGGDCGGMHTCVLVLDGSGSFEPECWGDNSKNQSAIPTSLSLSVDESYAGIATGGLHTCVAINHSNGSTSRVVCWGDDSKGQASPPISTGHNIEQITAGVAHTCMLLDDGAVECWGDSTYGVTTASSYNSYSFSQIDAGGYHTCGIMDSGSANNDPYGIRCWGRNDQSQASNDLMNMFDYVAAGDLHTCGVTQANTTPVVRSVLCWGNDDYGQTSNKPNTSGDYGYIHSNGHHPCLSENDGNGNFSLECWGWGDGTTGNGQTSTTAIHHSTSVGEYEGYCAGGRHTFSAASASGGNDYGFSGDTSNGQNRCSNGVSCQ